jgi:hypothetical protein
MATRKKAGDERPRAEALRVFERALRNALNTPPGAPGRAKKRAKAKK